LNPHNFKNSKFGSLKTLQKCLLYQGKQVLQLLGKYMAYSEGNSSLLSLYPSPPTLSHTHNHSSHHRTTFSCAIKPSQLRYVWTSTLDYRGTLRWEHTRMGGASPYSGWGTSKCEEWCQKWVGLSFYSF